MTIVVQNLTKKFGDLTAVDDVSMEIGDGEVVCLLGPSGCGKTTTLRMIAGLEWATEGRVLLSGDDVTDLAARDRNVAMAFQFYALYPSLSVRDNLAYPLHAEGHSPSAIQSKIDEVARVLQLRDILDRKPSQLAEGEKQRVAVGRSIIRDPRCFLFDEPLSRLDVALREQMRGEIKEVLTGLRKATVIVTHDQLEALTMADRIAVMRDGRIEQVASPHDIFRYPANLFVAGFIGTPQMNLISAVVADQSSDGKTVFDVEGGQSVAVETDPAVADLPVESKVTLGIRPRNLELVEVPVDGGMSSTIDLIEPMGAETLAHLNDGMHEIRVVTDWRTSLVEGAAIHVRFPTGSVHVFDEQGQAVRS